MSGLYRNNSLQKAQSAAPGDNERFMAVSGELLAMPKADLMDPEAVEARLGECFGVYAKHGLKPTVAGLALSLGINRQRLWEIRNGIDQPHSMRTKKLPPGTADAVKKAVAAIECMIESALIDGAANVNLIFLSKNYGYRDSFDIVPCAAPEAPPDMDEIRRRYLTQEEAPGGV